MITSDRRTDKREPLVDDATKARGKRRKREFRFRVDRVWDFNSLRMGQFTVPAFATREHEAERLWNKAVRETRHPGDRVRMYDNGALVRTWVAPSEGGGA